MTAESVDEAAENVDRAAENFHMADLTTWNVNTHAVMSVTTASCLRSWRHRRQVRHKRHERHQRHDGI
jgi:hypothetical protein